MPMNMRHWRDRVQNWRINCANIGRVAILGLAIANDKLIVPIESYVFLSRNWHCWRSHPSPKQGFAQILPPSINSKDCQFSWFRSCWKCFIKQQIELKLCTEIPMLLKVDFLRICFREFWSSLCSHKFQDCAFLTVTQDCESITAISPFSSILCQAIIKATKIFKWFFLFFLNNIFMFLLAFSRVLDSKPERFPRPIPDVKKVLFQTGGWTLINQYQNREQTQASHLSYWKQFV